MAGVDVLVPTCDRPAALAATLACLLPQTDAFSRLVVSDQGRSFRASDAREVRAIARLLEFRGVDVAFLNHLPHRGMAEHRQFLLDQVRAPYALFLDDDVLTEPDLVRRLVNAMERARCGFVGSFVNATSAVDATDGVDRCPDVLTLDLWDGPVEPERVEPGTPAWTRYRLHFAANLDAVCKRLGITRDCERLYRVAWIGGCVLFDVEKLRAVGGYRFWEQLPSEHVGEDVLAQLRVMAAFGGAGLAPSGAWHQEVRTTLPQRAVDAPLVLPLDQPVTAGEVTRAAVG